MAFLVFVTSGVVSSLGKGLFSASLTAILESRGLRVTQMKLDPCINVDPGTMSPFQHGEAYVTQDGAETDLDLGHYERFVQTRSIGRIRPSFAQVEKYRGVWSDAARSLKRVMVVVFWCNRLLTDCRGSRCRQDAALFLAEGSLALIPRGRRHKPRGNLGDKISRLEDIPIERIGDRFENMRFGGGGRLTQVTYYGVRFDPYLADRLIRLLPEMLQLRTQADDGSWLQSTIQFIAREARQRLPGSETVITRLADILVIQAIRSWIESVREEQHGWIAALHDRYIGKAMSLMHRQSERDWRVETLAREIGMSRSGFSARFTALMGESVLQYLTGLRMQLACRELRETSDTLAKIAERVGYQSEPAFNRAFKRVMGMPPGALRKLPAQH